MGIFIANLAYSVIKILINVELLEKVRSFKMYHAFPNILVIFDKYFSRFISYNFYCTEYYIDSNPNLEKLKALRAVLNSLPYG